VARWLLQRGHDVLSVYDKFRGATDEEVLETARRQERILVTADKDFGEMVFRRNLTHLGVLLLRLSDERPTNQIAVLEKLLDSHAELLPGRFVVATESTVRSVGPQR